MRGKSRNIRELVAAVACAVAAFCLPVSLASAQQVRAVPQTRAEITLSFAPVVKQAAPAVVNIYTKKVVERPLSPFAGDPFFDDFFRGMFPRGNRRRVENSLGSGVLLDARGIVVSNHHVVGGADEITVILQDKREFEGRVILADEDSDLAVVELRDASDLPVLELRDSDTLEVGDLVLAIGNPFGVGQTVTSGIVSGLTRRQRRKDRAAGFFIQTDAAINPGNSGGALVDMEGRLVGINTAILSRSGGSNGIGFAVPANLVARIVETALSGETELVRPWFGFEAQEVDGELAEALGLPTPKGIVIEEMHPTSPLSSSGLRRGDVLFKIDGVDVNSMEEFEFRTSTKPLGSSITVGVLSKDDSDSVEVGLAPAPDQPHRDRRTLAAADGMPGLEVLNINPSVIVEMDLGVTADGILVMSARGPARRVGFRRGDRILGVNGTQVATVTELTRELSRPRSRYAVDVERNGRVGKIRYER